MRETGTAHTDVLEQTEITNLVEREVVVKGVGGLLGVGLDAANVVGVLGLEVGHELTEGALEAERGKDIRFFFVKYELPGAGSDRALGGLVDRGAVGEDLLEDGVGRVVRGRLEILEQVVNVLVQEVGHVVCDIAGIVLDAENCEFTAFQHAGKKKKNIADLPESEMFLSLRLVMRDS